MTRSAFVSACKDLKAQFAKPIEDALRNAGLTLVSLIFFPFLKKNMLSCLERYYFCRFHRR